MPQENNYDNESRFVIFPNSRKEPNSKQPDYTGELQINGTKYRLSGWRSTSKGGTTYVSGRISDYDYQGNSGNSNSGGQVSVAPTQQPSNDDIPF